MAIYSGNPFSLLSMGMKKRQQPFKNLCFMLLCLALINHNSVQNLSVFEAEIYWKIDVNLSALTWFYKICTWKMKFLNMFSYNDAFIIQSQFSGKWKKLRPLTRVPSIIQDMGIWFSLICIDQHCALIEDVLCIIPVASSLDYGFSIFSQFIILENAV